MEIWYFLFTSEILVGDWEIGFITRSISIQLFLGWLQHCDQKYSEAVCRLSELGDWLVMSFLVQKEVVGLVGYIPSVINLERGGVVGEWRVASMFYLLLLFGPIIKTKM